MLFRAESEINGINIVVSHNENLHSLKKRGKKKCVDRFLIFLSNNYAKSRLIYSFILLVSKYDKLNRDTRIIVYKSSIRGREIVGGGKKKNMF